MLCVTYKKFQTQLLYTSGIITTAVCVCIYISWVLRILPFLGGSEIYAYICKHFKILSKKTKIITQ